MSNEYRSYCLRIGTASLLIILTWIWKNNASWWVLSDWILISLSLKVSTVFVHGAELRNKIRRRLNFIFHCWIKVDLFEWVRWSISNCFFWTKSWIKNIIRWRYSFSLRFSFWCNHLACVLLICVHISVFWKLDNNIYYSSFHPLFFGTCLWHIPWSLLNHDSLDFCRDFLRGTLSWPIWWSSCSYGWVLNRDGGMILMSICALIGLRYSQIVDKPWQYRTISIEDDHSPWNFLPQRSTLGRRWQQRRMRRFRCILRRFVVVKGFYTQRQNAQYLRRYLMRRSYWFLLIEEIFHSVISV